MRLEELLKVVWNESSVRVYHDNDFYFGCKRICDIENNPKQRETFDAHKDCLVRHVFAVEEDVLYVGIE